MSLREKIERLEDALLEVACELDCDTDEVLQTEGLLLGNSGDSNYPMWLLKIVPQHWRDRLVFNEVSEIRENCKDEDLGVE